MSTPKAHLAVPTVVAILAAVVILRSFGGIEPEGAAAYEAVSDPTPFSADHARAARTGASEEQPATF